MTWQNNLRSKLIWIKGPTPLNKLEYAYKHETNHSAMYCFIEEFQGSAAVSGQLRRCM